MEGRTVIDFYPGFSHDWICKISSAFSLYLIPIYFLTCKSVAIFSFWSLTLLVSCISKDWPCIYTSTCMPVQKITFLLFDLIVIQYSSLGGLAQSYRSLWYFLFSILVVLIFLNRFYSCVFHFRLPFLGENAIKVTMTKSRPPHKSPSSIHYISTHHHYYLYHLISKSDLWCDRFWLLTTLVKVW